MLKKIIVFKLVLLLVFMFFFMTLSSCIKTDIEETDVITVKETSEQVSMGTETVTDTTSEVTEGIENDENSGSNNQVESTIKQDESITEYKSKNISIKKIYSEYVEVFTGSIDIEADQETGKASGYIFISYMEVQLKSGRSYPCRNIMKGTITGLLDNSSKEFNGEGRVSISADGSDCFNGDIIVKIKGNLSEDGMLIRGYFILLSGNELNFLLEKVI